VELFDLCYLLGPKERIIIRIIEDTYSKKKQNEKKRKETEVYTKGMTKESTTISIVDTKY